MAAHDRSPSLARCSVNARTYATANFAASDPKSLSAIRGLDKDTIKRPFGVKCFDEIFVLWI